MTRENVARICHEVNRGYCMGLGDFTQPNWEGAPDWQQTSALNGVNRHIATIRSGGTPNPAESHESWLEEKRATGWKFGAIKDPSTKEHPCFVPFADLPADQKLKDTLFVAVVVAFEPAVTD